MDREFEDECMDAQSQIISLCVEFAGNRADKVYAYGSIEESSISFNAFFKIDGQIKTTNNIAADTDSIWNFLDLGESDLEKMRRRAYDAVIGDRGKRTGLCRSDG